MNTILSFFSSIWTWFLDLFSKKTPPVVDDFALDTEDGEDLDAEDGDELDAEP